MYISINLLYHAHLLVMELFYHPIIQLDSNLSFESSLPPFVVFIIFVHIRYTNAKVIKKSYYNIKFIEISRFKFHYRYNM